MRKATIISQVEAEPAAYPAPLSGLVTAASDLAWQRIESYIAWRFTEREVTWIVEGPGEFVPPLRVSVISTTERWCGAWQPVTDLELSPLGGYCLPGCGPYRFVATVGGGGDPPAGVQEAVRRLAEYNAAVKVKPGIRSESVQAGTVSLSTTRSPTAAAEALQNSGAADLLRNYRRA